MKFGDVVTALATATVIMVFVAFPLGLVLIPALGYWGSTVNTIVSTLIATLVVGYIFATCIWEENRIKAIAKITVLGAVLMILIGIMEISTFGDWTAWVKETHQAANPAAELSAYEWLQVESMFLGLQVFINVIIVLVTGFIGLYIGSMLRKLPKSQK